MAENENSTTCTLMITSCLSPFSLPVLLETSPAYMYKLIQSSSSRYLRDLVTVQPSRSTRSSAMVTLLQPSVDPSLKITNRSFWYAVPHLWNRLPPIVRFPYQFDPSWSSSSSWSSYSDHGPLVDLSCGVFHSRLKTCLWEVFPPQPSIPSSGWSPGIMTTDCLGNHWRCSIGKCAD